MSIGAVGMTRRDKDSGPLSPALAYPPGRNHCIPSKSKARRIAAIALEDLSGINASTTVSGSMPH